MGDYNELELKAVRCLRRAAVLSGTRMGLWPECCQGAVMEQQWIRGSVTAKTERTHENEVMVADPGYGCELSL